MPRERAGRVPLVRQDAAFVHSVLFTLEYTVVQGLMSGAVKG